MGRLEKRAAEKMKKHIMKSKKIPDEKKEEVIEAFSKVDLGLILQNPEAIADIIENPGHLINYVRETPDSPPDEEPEV